MEDIEIDVDLNLMKRFASYYKPHWKLLTLDLVCAFLASGLDLLFPIFTRQFLNDFIPTGDIDLIWVYGGLMVILYLLQTAANYVMAYWGHIVGVSMEYDMRDDLFKHIQTLDVEYFDNNKTGRIMARLTNDLRDVSELAHHGPEDLFISLVMLMGAFILLVQTHVLLTLIIFSVMIVMIWFVASKRKKMLKTFKRTRRTHADINAHLESSISGIRLTKSFANEPYELEKFQVNNYAYRESYKAAYKQMAEFHSGSSFFLNILSVIALVIGGWFAYENWIPVDDIIMFILYTQIFIGPIRKLVQFTQQFQEGFAGFSRFAEVMQIQPSIKDKENAVAISDPKGKIELKGVDFRYSKNTPYVFRDFHLTIEPSKTIALVGPSGVGKTTIAYLIPRFYDVKNGAVLVDGINVRHIRLESLRQNVGYVQQDVIVFYGSIRENILYGRPDATDPEIVDAARKANIHDFIMSTPDQYETIVGERGVKLSGGQKQRLALARVFLRDPPILILDEATSSLDNVTELAIQDSIEEIAKDRTTLIIAHRLSTIKNSDEIIVLADDGIVERGTHDELVVKGGMYSELYKAQFKGYIPDSVESRMDLA